LLKQVISAFRESLITTPKATALFPITGASAAVGSSLLKKLAANASYAKTKK
jgi:hypothetical protein